MNSGPYAKCPVCLMERETRNGEMKNHRKWEKSAGKMVFCLGSGKPPVRGSVVK